VASLAPLQANAAALGALNNTDITSVGNISTGGGVITAPEWNHVRSLDQDLSTTSTPTFAGLNATNDRITNLGAPIANSDAARLQDILNNAVVAGNGLTETGLTIDVGGSTTIFAAANNIFVNSSATANQVLLSQGTVGNQATWGAVPLANANAVTGILPLANGGTNSSLTGVSGAVAYSTGSQLSLTSAGTTGQVLTSQGAAAPIWTSAAAGSVTSVSVNTANGLAGTVTNPTTTPALTLSTTVTGIAKGNGTALSAATAGTDYSAGTSGLATGILKSTTGTGALSIAVAADFPTLNQNTTGTAANVTGIVEPVNGGTGVAQVLPLEL
jgi:hypothetical protein